VRHSLCPKPLKPHPWGVGIEVFVLPDEFIVLRTTRYGHTYGGCLLPFTSHPAAAQRLEIARAIWGGCAMKRKDPTSVPGLAYHASPELTKGHYPSLTEFMTTAAFEDGTRRESPTLTLWAQGGQWKLTLRDRAEALVMWLSAEKLLELLQLAELFCLSGDGPWRIDEYGSPEKGKRQKK
jgi:hypothetical protein